MFTWLHHSMEIFFHNVECRNLPRKANGLRCLQSVAVDGFACSTYFALASVHWLINPNTIFCEGILVDVLFISPFRFSLEQAMSIFNKSLATIALGVIFTATASIVPNSVALAKDSSSKRSSSSSHDKSSDSSSDDSHDSSSGSVKCKPHISSSQIKDYGYYKSTVAHGTCLDLIGTGVIGATPKVQVAQPDGTFELLPLGNGTQNPVSDDFYTINSATELEIVTHRPSLSYTDMDGLFEIKLERCDLVNGAIVCGDKGKGDDSDDEHGHRTQLILVPLVNLGA